MFSEANELAKGSGDLRGLISAVLDFSRGRRLQTVTIVVLAALLEGMGIVLLLPIAEIVFAQTGTTPSSGFAEYALHSFEMLGIESRLAQLLTMGAIFLVLMVVRALILMRREFLLMRLTHGFVDYEKQKLFFMLAKAEWPVVKQHSKAELLTAMTSNIGRLAQAIRFLSSGMVSAGLGAVSLGAAFVVSTALGLTLSALVALGIGFAILWSHRSWATGERLSSSQFSAIQETTRFLDGLKVAKVTRAENKLAEGYAARIRQVRETQMDFIRQQSLLRNGLYLAAAFIALAVLLAGVGLVGLGPTELLIMVVIIARLAPSVIATATGAQSIAHALPAFRAIRALEQSLEKAHTALPASSGERCNDSTPDLSTASLKLRAASVQLTSESGQTITLLHAGDITIRPGELVHISGPSGSGKSTLVELIAALHLPAEGKVVCGALTLSHATQRIWQSQVSFVPQEPFIFDGSVRENLCWPNVQAEESDLWEALDDAQAKEVVARLPQQLDEPLLEGGARLSGGERQRLCLARAFLSKAKLMVLDEATSALDSELERSIIERLKQSEPGRITLMVSHSLKARDLADREISVRDGLARVLSD